MVTIHANGKKQIWLKKDGNKLSKRKLPLYENNEDFIFIKSRIQTDNIQISFEEIPLVVTKIKNIEYILKMIELRNGLIDTPEMLYLICCYGYCNKVRDFLGLDIEIKVKEYPTELYERLSEKMDIKHKEYFDNAIIFDYSKLDKHYQNNQFKF